MYFCYFDESGDSGYVKSPSSAFTLATVLVSDQDWLQTLNQLIGFRRYLRDNFGIPPRMELKAYKLIHNKEPFKSLGLSRPALLNAFLAAMRFQRKVGTIRTFAVVINKGVVQKKRDPREWAWMMAIERLERFGNAQGQNMHILPDEGHGYFIRRKLREMRRIHHVPTHFVGPKHLDRKALNLIEDSSDRQSHESYFIQLADLDAFAAYRYVYPRADFGRAYWDELGDARVNEVNKLRGGPTAIVSWP